ncbi:KRAB-A domain-containing protein 2-like [Cimex lectularius]|uniref:Integrase zinc-binding domain-containing protein n=1 Tax=Cimex lectularius TaxID=79782 RepID=A0A8I6SJC3_CIMLE|nr:KRAB-A domain-containing protein 2-like [Cimex lectularius]
METFDDEIQMFDLNEEKSIDRKRMKREKYEEIIAQVLDAKARKNKTWADRVLTNKFDVLLENGEKKLIEPLKPGKNSIRYYVHDDILIDVLTEVHESLGHGGRDKMYLALKEKYKNVGIRSIQEFIQGCNVCCMKLLSFKNVTKPADFISRNVPYVKEIQVRGHVELLNFSHNPDGEFNYVMVYQDLETDFTVLRSVRTNTAEEVADKLVDVFTMIGAPYVLESDEERIFVHEIIAALKRLWPELKIVSGKTSAIKYDMTLKFVEMIETWMKDSKSQNWSHGLRFVQLLKNISVQSHYKSPFDLVFKQRIKMGISSDIVPYSQLASLNTEEDFIEALQQLKEPPDSPHADGINRDIVIHDLTEADLTD